MANHPAPKTPVILSEPSAMSIAVRSAARAGPNSACSAPHPSAYGRTLWPTHLANHPYIHYLAIWAAFQNIAQAATFPKHPGHLEKPARSTTSP